MLDDAMALHSGKEWVYETHTTPKMAWHSRGEISEPILLSDFLDNSCRNLNEAKVTSIAFDVHKNVPEFSGLAQIGELLSQGNIADVPFPLRLQGPLPPKATLGVIIENHHDGTMSLIKILHFANKITAAAAQRLITQERASCLCHALGHGRIAKLSSPYWIVFVGEPDKKGSSPKRSVFSVGA